MSTESLILDELIKNVTNYGVLVLWTIYLLFKEQRTHKEFLNKLNQMIEEIKRIKK